MPHYLLKNLTIINEGVKYSKNEIGDEPIVQVNNTSPKVMLKTLLIVTPTISK